MQTITKSKKHRTFIRVMTAIVLAGFAIVPAQAAVQRYYGLYRGVVVANVDPLNSGRVLIEVPDIAGAKPMGWAMPVLHYPYSASSLKLPQAGQGVWIEFEQGNPDYPVWIGAIPRMP
jgi:hypothetical protein